MSSQFNAQVKTVQKLVSTGTWTSVEIEMPKSPRKGMVPAIIGVEVLHPVCASTKYSHWYLTATNNDSEPGFDDEDIILAGRIDPVTSLQVIPNLIETVKPPAPIPVSKSKIYMGFVEDGQATHTYRVRIYWVPRWVKGAIQQESMDVSIQF